MSASDVRRMGNANVRRSLWMRVPLVRGILGELAENCYENRQNTDMAVENKDRERAREKKQAGTPSFSVSGSCEFEDIRPALNG
ncbi:hypothetical protein RvY_08213 [Ramazzottius varieornatus]|uniref:Uncharacterized protein n=1 Tax=Ramazzottius varieornatus TaxID=947166 RepID=A0A1D1V526_RAMVA|nr:hypothetical protein RvY_08213 [Ramazzottius varieornatus]